jgi:hypothetical protein
MQVWELPEVEARVPLPGIRKAKMSKMWTITGPGSSKGGCEVKDELLAQVDHGDPSS